MVSIRCKMVVKSELEKLGVPYTKIDLGEVELNETPSATQLNELSLALKKTGLELMDDNKSILIEKIKNIIIEHINYTDEPPAIKFSEFLSQKLNHD